MNAIENNPYRQLGVYANSPIKERVSNTNRLKAFLKVGKSVDFPLDLQQYLPPISRTSEMIAQAEAQLALPNDQLRYAQFWFIKATPIDEIAFNHLFNGNMENAVNMWGKKDNASSLQNRLVCALIQKNYADVMSYAERLYTQYSSQFASAILGENGNVSSETLAFDFLDCLCDEVGANAILPSISIDNWKAHVGEKTVNPLIKQIQSAIDSAKSTKGKGPAARYNAGIKLIRETKPLLQQLASFLSKSDLQYQMIADKLGLEILQCGIDYYNNSDDDDAAHKAMKIQKYAQSVVVGKMAKDRCDENVQILESIISELPPIEVMAHHNAIQHALATFATQPELIKYAIQLIKGCVPHVVAIKEALGRDHQYYLKISTQIVNNALGNVIAEVNKSLKKDFETLKSTLISAWRTQLYLDKFDLEAAYKESRFKENRAALHNIIEERKGFMPKSFSHMYRYGCGWCNDLDVSDVDLRTDDEYFATCGTLTSYKLYIEKYPHGKHVSEAQDKRDRIARHEKAIASCFTLNDILTLYAKEKSKNIDINKCSIRAYELARNKSDYQIVLSTFTNRSVGGEKAEKKIAEIEETKSKIRNWAIGIGALIILLAIIYSAWGWQGLWVVFIIAALISRPFWK